MAGNYSEIQSGIPRNRAMEAQEWNEFKTYINGFSLQDQSDIEHAYIVGETAHRGQKRKSGEPYFSHPKECAIILIEAGVTWRQPIVLALLHDVQEDTDYLEQAFSPPGDTISKSWDRIAGSFDEETAFMLDSLTEFDEDVYSSKKEAERLYHEGFEWADPDAILVKMADRLHNLRTLRAMPKEKQIAKIEETKKVYSPIFNSVLTTYPVIGGSLLTQIHAAIQAAEIEL